MQRRGRDRPAGKISEVPQTGVDIVMSSSKQAAGYVGGMLMLPGIFGGEGPGCSGMWRGRMHAGLQGMQDQLFE